MDLRQLQYAVTVGEELNFTRAATRCHIAQSGLSHQIAQLEREIGAPLFRRTSRSVQLTRAGHVFLPYARRLLRDAEEAVAAVTALGAPVSGVALETEVRIIGEPGVVAADAADAADAGAAAANGGRH